MESLLNLLEVQEPEIDEQPLFSSIVIPRHNWVPAAAGSLIVHALGLALAMVAQEYFPLFFQSNTLDSVYVASLVPLRPGERLYYYAEPPKPRPAPRAEGGAPATRQAAASRQAKLRLPPNVVIPPLPAAPRSEALVIQPSRELADLLSPVPAIAAWAPSQRPTPKAFVQPGRARTEPAKPVLSAPPSLDRPNLEPRVGTINIGRAPRLYAPALELPASSTAPVQLVDAPTGQAGAAYGGLGPPGGDAVNLIAAGPAMLPPNTYVNIPPGVSAGNPGNAVQAGSDTTGNSSSMPGASSGSAVRSGTGTAGAGGAGGSGPGRGGTSAAGSATGDGTGGRGADPSIIGVSVSASLPIPPGFKPVTRPKEGKYTFMVTGSKPGELFPETEGLLSGTLVYTVYLGIGVRPDWVLQYCLPTSAPAAAGPLDAPYPYLMLLPPLSYDWDEERVFVHGMLDPAGRLQRLRLIGDAPAADKDMLMESLNRWEFRPATRGGKPVALEVLLIVPKRQR